MKIKSKNINIIILVRDKMTWNSFIDKIDYGLYPNLIVIFTSNQNKKYIDSLDKSYIREGRINILRNFINLL